MLGENLDEDLKDLIENNVELNSDDEDYAKFKYYKDLMVKDKE